MIDKTYAEFISPISLIQIGDYEVKRLISLDVTSSRINPCDLANMTIDIQDATGNIFQQGNPVSISLGYREMGLWTAFEGFITDVSMGRQIDIFTKDHMVQLLNQKITKTFINAAPQEIISFCLRAAGVDKFILTTQNLPKKHHFVVAGLSAIEVIKLVNRSWNLDWDFYFEPEGSFYWGPWAESERYQKDIITFFEYGKNIIKLTPSDEETGTMETILLPFLRHSTLIKIIDKTYWRKSVTARIERLRHRMDQNYARTFIEWRIQPN